MASGHTWHKYGRERWDSISYERDDGLYRIHVGRSSHSRPVKEGRWTVGRRKRSVTYVSVLVSSEELLRLVPAATPPDDRNYFEVELLVLRSLADAKEAVSEIEMGRTPLVARWVDYEQDSLTFFVRPAVSGALAAR